MKRYSEEEKEMWAEDWKESGKSLTVYAKANGLKPQSLKSWTKAQTKQGGFIELIPAEDRSASAAAEILIEKGDIKIHIPIAINRNDLRTVIESLGCAL
jgi:transposase-like protein